MSPTVRAVLIGAAAAGALAVALSVVARATGAATPAGVLLLLPIVLSVAVASFMSRPATNRAERQLTGAERAAAVALTPTAGGALLVVTREGEVGQALGLEVAVDGFRAAQLRSPRAVVFPVVPGAHHVAVAIPKAKGGPPGGALRVQVAPGEVAFVAVRMVMGMARNTVVVQRAEDPARQRAALASLTLVAPEPDWDAEPAGGRA